MRDRYPGTVLRPYYGPPSQPAYAITALLNAVPDDMTLQTIAEHAL